MMFSHITILGTGLIGASVGRAMLTRGLVCDVTGVGRNEENLQNAQKVGAITRYTTSLKEGVRDAQLVLVGTPVNVTADLVCQAVKYTPEGTLFTDVGSTKKRLVKQLCQGTMPLENGCRFLGAHPIAGKETSGASQAEKDLFRERVTILTPAENTLSTDVETLTHLWEALGARVVCMNADEHDRILAQTSHLPHVLSVTLSAMLSEKVMPYGGTGLESMVRLAGGSIPVWSSILQDNRDPILDQINVFINHLNLLKAALCEENTGQLEAILERARNHHHALGNRYKS